MGTETTALVLPDEQQFRRDIQAINRFQQVVHSTMVQGLDYGVIPGTQKPTLLKPGAEKIAKLLGLSDQYEIMDKVEDWQAPFFRYLIKCKLIHVASGALITEGMGECNSMESKYRWRWVGERDLPAGIDKSKLVSQERRSQAGGRWTVYRFDNEDIYSQVNCVTPETRILTRDLRWIPAGNIQTGERIIAVEEERETRYKRAFLDAEVTVYGRRVDTLYEIILSDGRKVRCNGEHKWLVQKVGLKGTEWIATDEILEKINEKSGRPRHWAIKSLCLPWEEENTKEAGYIAGLFDADGTLGVTGIPYPQIIATFAQQSNGVLGHMKSALRARAFALGEVNVGNQKAKEPVYHLRVQGGLVGNMRLLGTIRPPRLMERWNNAQLEGKRFEGKSVRIENIHQIGQGEIVLLGSTVGTYIAEGLIAHNTILKMSKKRALVDAALSAGRLSDVFTQDIEDMGDVIKTETRKPLSVKAKPASAQVVEPDADSSKPIKGEAPGFEPESDGSSPSSAPESHQTKRHPNSVKTLTELMKACHEDFKLQPAEVLAELGVNSQNDISDTPADCYRQVATPRQVIA